MQQQSQRVFLLTNKQYKRRFFMLFAAGNAAFFSYIYQRQYIMNKSDLFYGEYFQLKKNPNFYHTLHE